MALAKVVVIGAGLSGLSSACLLAARGADVTVLEANDKAGGCCATTASGGYTFHDGALYVAALPLLDAAFERLGLDRAALVPLRRIAPAFSVALPDGTIVTLNEGADLRIEGRPTDERRLREELRRLLERWAPAFDAMAGRVATQPFSAWRALRYGWRHLHKLRGSAGAELRRLFADERIRAALAGTMLHAGAAPDALPAAAMLGVATVLRDGLFLPEGGMGRIPDALAAALRARGGELRLSSPVRRIVVEHGRAIGVETAAGERIEAAAVVSTASPMATFASLVAPPQVPAAMRRRIERAPLSHRAVSLQFGLSNRVQPRAVINMALPLLEEQGQVMAQEPRAVAWPVYSVPTLTLPELAPAGGSVVEMFVPVSGAWDKEEDKQALAESALRALRRFHDAQVVVSRVRTPNDFRDGMHLYEGALYGLSPNVAPQEQFAQTSPIRGLFLAGQSTFPGYGVAPSMLSGAFAAEALLGIGV